jgi:hypothetical protein
VTIALDIRTRPTLAEVEVAIGWPSSEWAGNCYAVACAVAGQARRVRGRPAYGHYLGEVRPGSRFFGRQVVHHGWVVLEDGGVLDPTRWEFEQVAPYLHWADGVGAEYDEGGNALRDAMERPAPARVRADKLVSVGARDLPVATRRWMERELGMRERTLDALTVNQVFWFANLSLRRLGAHARPIFSWLARRGREQAVPIDNFRLVMGEGRSP